MDTSEQNFSNFLKNAELISCLRLGKHVNRDDVFVSEATEAKANSVLGHWTTIIMLASSSIRITFKAHYNSEDLLVVVRNMLPLDGVPYSQRAALIADLMKEFCNLFGGAMKTLLEENGIPSGLSLPLVTRGFDQLFNSIPRRDSILHSWALNCAGSKIITQIQIDILDEPTRNTLKAIKVSKDLEKNDGSLEFF